MKTELVMNRVMLTFPSSGRPASHSSHITWPEVRIQKFERRELTKSGRNFRLQTSNFRLPVGIGRGGQASVGPNAWRFRAAEEREVGLHGAGGCGSIRTVRLSLQH